LGIATNDSEIKKKLKNKNFKKIKEN
jgi:hypothetical protein